MICLAYPFYDREKLVLLSLVAFLGLCNSIAFSAAYQIVTHFHTDNSVALTTGKTVIVSASSFEHSHTLSCTAAAKQTFCTFSGFVASGPVVVLAEAALGIGSGPTEAQQIMLFVLVTAITCAGWLLFTPSACMHTHAVAPDVPCMVLASDWTHTGNQYTFTLT